MCSSDYLWEHSVSLIEKDAFRELIIDKLVVRLW